MRNDNREETTPAIRNEWDIPAIEWNDSIEATPKERKDWIVPALFVLLAVIGAFAFGFSLV